MQYLVVFKAFKALSYWVFVLFYLFFPACPKKPIKPKKNPLGWALENGFFNPGLNSLFFELITSSLLSSCQVNLHFTIFVFSRVWGSHASQPPFTRDWGHSLQCQCVRFSRWLMGHWLQIYYNTVAAVLLAVVVCLCRAMRQLADVNLRPSVGMFSCQNDTLHCIVLFGSINLCCFSVQKVLWVVGNT